MCIEALGRVWLQLPDYVQSGDGGDARDPWLNKWGVAVLCSQVSGSWPEREGQDDGAAVSHVSGGESWYVQ